MNRVLTIQFNWFKFTWQIEPFKMIQKIVNHHIRTLVYRRNSENILIKLQNENNQNYLTSKQDGDGSRLIISAKHDGNKKRPPPAIGCRPLKAFRFGLNGNILAGSGAGNLLAFRLDSLLNGLKAFGSYFSLPTDSPLLMIKLLFDALAAPKWLDMFTVELCWLDPLAIQFMLSW